MKSQRIVLLSMIGTGVVAIAAEANRGRLTESLPTIVVGGAVAFFIVGMIAETVPDLGRALAALIFIGALFSRGSDALDTIGRQTERKGKKQ